MPISIDGSGSITGISTGGLEDGIITPAELSTGGPSWDASGSLQVNSINNGPLAGMRNAIINGNFDIWQRGTSGSAPNYAAADRWVNAISGSGCTMSRQAFTPGQTDVPGEPTYFCRMAVTSVAGAGNIAILTQVVEDVRTFAGQQITVSFWAKADATKSIAIETTQNFGTGGSPSALVLGMGVTKVLVGTSWQKITFTTTVSSIGGKTIGSDGNSSLGFNIWFDAGSNFNLRTDSLGQQSGTFDIAQVQVEAGPVATPFERRPIGTELALCQRYFEKSFNLETAPVQNVGSLQGALTTSGVSTSNNVLLGHANFAAEKRAVPTVTTFNPFSAGSGWSQSGALDRSASIYSVGTRALNIRVDTASSSATANMSIHWAASAEL
jgi:hypothetical protein